MKNAFRFTDSKPHQVIDYYRQKNKLLTVNADDEVENITAFVTNVFLRKNNMIAIKSHRSTIMQKAGELAQSLGRWKIPYVMASVHGSLTKIAYEVITSEGATPSFLNYNGYPKVYASVNNVVIHGFRPKYDLKGRRHVGIDIGTFFNNYHGDNAATYGQQDFG